MEGRRVPIKEEISQDQRLAGSEPVEYFREIEIDH